QLLAVVVRGDHLAARARPVGVDPHDQARRVLANDQPALRVVRHAVALVAGPHHLPDAALLVPAAPDVPGNVAEEQEAAFLVPERPLCEDEAGAQPLDLGIALDEVVQLLGFGVYGHTLSCLGRCRAAPVSLRSEYPTPHAELQVRVR